MAEKTHVFNNVSTLKKYFSTILILNDWIIIQIIKIRLKLFGIFWRKFSSLSCKHLDPVFVHDLFFSIYNFIDKCFIWVSKDAAMFVALNLIKKVNFIDLKIFLNFINRDFDFRVEHHGYEKKRSINFTLDV